MQLNIDPEEFLRTHWQREPLYIPKGMLNFELPADANELAGLALEEDVDSQIVRRSGNEWSKESGPFDEPAFQQSGAWSLLVQSVDHYWDSAAELLTAVSFLPSWRLDDIMMSFATDGGSAGPHYDNYDVFIIQGEGRRLWQLGQRCDESTALLPSDGLKLIADFQANAEFEMTQGDVLYIPPGVAHYGVSLGESTSFSIGFRAPRIDALLARWLDDQLEGLGADRLFQDAGRAITNTPGEISASDLERVREQLRAAMDAISPTTLGEVVTDAALDASVAPSDDDFEAAHVIYRDPAARLAYFVDGENLLVFANGQSRRAPLSASPIIEALCVGSAIETQSLDSSDREILRWLWTVQGIVSDD